MVRYKMAYQVASHLDDNTLYSIQYGPTEAREVTESTPLLGSAGNRRAIRREMSFVRFYHTGWYTIFGVALLFVILILGIVSGTYLLLVEDYIESDPTLRYNVVTRDSWHAKSPKRLIAKAARPLERVVIAHTASEECKTHDHCKKLLQLIQNQQMEPEYDAASMKNETFQGIADIAYNFLLAANGDIYEGRGWDFQCELEDSTEHNNNTLAVAFIGNYVNQIPSMRMLKVLQVLLQKAVDSEKLKSCFTLWIQDDFLQSYSSEIVPKLLPKNKHC